MSFALPTIDTEVRIALPRVALQGNLTLAPDHLGLIVFAHGSGSSRFSPRNKAVARALNEAHFGTLLFDLLTPQEARTDERTHALRFDIDLLANRLIGVTDWLGEQAVTAGIPIGYFGASTGGAAALVAAAARPGRVVAVVSRGGRPDLAGAALARVKTPTLLIVGGNDDVVIGMNEEARAAMKCEVTLEIIPGADHLFSDPGQLEHVAEISARWLHQQLERR
jgi:putative phosphoribosyl transferase